MKWLHAGVMEKGELHEVKAGTPQGGIMTPPTQLQTSTGGVG
jgi:retron-type reverse transcriptase